MRRYHTIVISVYLALMLTGCSLQDLPLQLPGLPGAEPAAVTEEAPAVEPAPAPAPAPAMEVVETPIMETVSEEEAEPEPEPVKIVFAGDINFDRRYANMNALMGRGGEITDALDGEIIETLSSADIAMVNNEFPYSDRGTPRAGKKFTFRVAPSTVHYMLDMGIDIVGLANNHAYDHGPEALLDTFDTLSGAGIRYVGAGRNIDEAMTPQYFEAGGMTIAFTAATQIERSLPPDTKEATETDPGVLRCLDPEKYVQVIREADENADFTIAFVHWGTENVHEYEASQRELAEAFAEAGADLIIGAHPHVIQGFDHVGDVPVIYSMGNFWFSSKTLDSCLIEATLFQGELKELRFIPCVQKGCFTSMKHPGDGEYERILEDERRRSAPGVYVSEEGVISTASGNETPEEAENP